MKTKLTNLVEFNVSDNIALIKLDDQGNNLISPAMIRQLNEALDKAEKNKYAVILTGTREVLSAGFDL